ncbi:L,D-transpeptidase [Pseudaminobacter sp. 19-2017]|uniref:L,D-transpeptidase n=1 Tax=Pseudaminobacter soli (ex Zhang et al. 2022) TaxID=2831468 RepID=A0A942I9P8_9HYPH|nr:L,D-transpeptidase [Pseudaminobacter soli]MBS3649611.1 L,D-transpeptidase [Pseudaminobacter soli]
MSSTAITRRHCVLGATSLAALALGGCVSTPVPVPAPKQPEEEKVRPELLGYGPLPHERFPVRAARLDLIDPKYYRQIVEDPTGERPGTVVVDTQSRFLYWVMPGGKAMRYGVGIGRDGFAWGGRAIIAYKREWPRWTPPAEMIQRQPDLEKYRYGMEPSLTNPLGARALYIHQDGRDTLYRLHGTMEEHTIGKAISSGCVRLLFHDVIDLHDRVRDGSPIHVIH